MSFATFAGRIVHSALVAIPPWGVGTAELTVEGEEPIAGVQTLELGELSIVGTVRRSGKNAGNREVLFVAGANAWGKTVRSKFYRNELGVKASTIAKDLATATGETLDFTGYTERRVGVQYDRHELPAGHTMTDLFGHDWYVGEDGITRVVPRPPGIFTGEFVVTAPLDEKSQRARLVLEEVVGLVPGTTIQLDVDEPESAVTIGRVQHALEGSSFRTTIWRAAA